MNYVLKTVFSLFMFGLLASGCVASKKAEENVPDSGSPVGMANPASVNCEKVGGTLSMETLPGGGQYGVCIFEDNRQCEEWALMRGECPVGGRKITGYVTPAARFCAITGGEYTGGEDDKDGVEQGTCSKSGKTCDVHAYYNSKCDL